MKKKILLLAFLNLSWAICFSQAEPDPNPVLTADSLATGNFKDVFNSFFQLAFDRLTGSDKEIKFTSTPFAVMARMDTSLLVDRKYVKYKALRKINFSFSGKLDEDYRFNGFSSGIKYAIINKRDETVSEAFLDLVQNNEVVKELFRLNDSIFAVVTQKPLLINDYTAFRKGEKNLNQLDPELQSIILKAANNIFKDRQENERVPIPADFNLNKQASKIYEELKSNYNNKLLWTVGVSDTTYNDQFMFSNVVLNTELVKGISKPENRNLVELNIQGALQFVNDSTLSERNLKRSAFTMEAGVNWSLRTRQTLRSFLELKFAGSYTNVLNGVYFSEEKNRLLLNTTLRVRILNDIWLPLEISYDPENGNLLGFISVKANFKSLGNIAKHINQ